MRRLIFDSPQANTQFQQVIEVSREGATIYRVK
jgi:hypothetical protein